MTLRRKNTVSLPFSGHFTGESGLAGFIGAKDDGAGGNNWSYKTCKNSNHHQQISVVIHTTR